MKVSSIMVDGKLVHYGAIDVDRHDRVRIQELIDKGFWCGVECGNTYVMLKILKEIT